MDLQNKYRLALGGLVTLVILNLLVLGWLWFVRFPRHGGPHHDERPGVQHIINKRLHLSPDQQRKFQKMRSDYGRKVRIQRKNLGRYRHALYNSVDAQDSPRVDSLIHLMGRSQQKIMWLNIQHFRSLQSILTDSQKVIFRRMLNRMSNVKAHNRPDPRQGLPHK